MLDFLRRSSTSVFAWLILGLLAAAFGLSFGLPSDSLTFGPSAMVKVEGEKIGDEEYRFQFNLVSRVVRIPKDPKFQQLMGFKEEILESAIEREILAHEAEELGLAATTTDAEDLAINGHLIVLGETYDWLGDMAFDYQLFTNAHLQSLQVSEKKYLELQRKEYLARTLRDVVASSVTVSEAEMRQQYEAQGNRLSIEYARYESRQFAQAVDPTEAEIDAWITDHAEELEQALATQGSRFTKLPEQVRLWVIEVPKGEDDAATADAKKAVESAAARVKQGEDFRAVARTVSKHVTAPGGGDYGWVSTGSGTGLDPVVDEALSGLRPPAVSGPLEGESAFYLVRVSGQRSGDVPKEDAFRELAAEAVKESSGRALAKAAAEADLAKLEEGTDASEVFASPGGIENAGLSAGSAAKAELRETGPFPKDAPIPGLGLQPTLVEAAWSSEPGGPILDQVFEVGGDYVLARLADKLATSDEGYLEVRDDLYEQAIARKGALVTARWAARLCLEAKGRGDLVTNDEKVDRIITYDVPEGEEQPDLKPYNVCDRVGNRGGLLRAGVLGGR